MTRDKDIRFVEVDGLKIRVLARNLDDNLDDGQVPLLVLNGLGQSIEILAPLIGELGDRPVVTFDMPGIGRSQMTDRPLAISQYARIAADVLLELGVRDYDVLGISWGGSVAQQLAYDDPTHCRKMILAVSSAGGLVSWWGSPVALSEIMFPLRFRDKDYGNMIGPLMYGGEAVMHPELFREYSRHALRPTMEGYFSQVRALCSWSSVCWLHRITQPVLVIAGMFDSLIPFPNQLLLAQNIPTAELKVYPTGHLVLFSRRREIGRLMEGFLDRGHDPMTERRRELTKALAWA